MPLRPPLGRAGRPWLAHRLTLAERGADLLEYKRRALSDDERALATQARATRSHWERLAREADRWLLRAELLGGERQRRLAAAHVASHASVTLHWRSAAGVTRPTTGELVITEAAQLSGLQPSSAVLEAADAHKRALDAALEHAIATSAHSRVARELSNTVRRLRAIEKRWIPLHEDALASLELALDEADREDAVRSRWVLERHRPAETRPEHVTRQKSQPETRRGT